MNIYKEQRPWGNFTQYIHNTQCTVKILEVNTESALSYQYHNKRDEFWEVLSGNPIIVINEKEHQAKPRDRFEIPRGTKHRIKGATRILEISTGEFDEQDIVRIEDKYQRM